MASNRAQRRAAYKKGKRPGETYADQLARQKMIKEAVEKTAHDESVALESDIKTQRFLWMAVVANHIAFGHAGIRSQRFMLTLDDVREDLEKMAAENGWEYAVEKLREQCEKITGMEVKQVHEDRMIQARKENEAKGVFFPAEDPEDLARIGFTDEENGRWYAKFIRGGFAEEWAYVCSECGCTISDKSGLGKYKGENQQLHFCPNCGKRMGEMLPKEGMHGS